MSRFAHTLLVFFITLAAIAALAPAASPQDAAATPLAKLCGGGILNVPLTELVSDADLVLQGPVERSESGIPIGNGRMGTLLWTDPSQLHMQINRVDVFANNKDTASFPQRYSDYCGGCAFVDVNLAGLAGDEFTSAMTQRLSCNDGLATIEGAHVQLKTLAWTDGDVIAVEVTDKRPSPGAATVTLRMLRPAIVHHFQHTATSKVAAVGNDITLTQSFDEGNYHCGTAVAIRILGPGVRVETNGDEATIATSGSFVVLISSAASFDSKADLVAAARAELDKAAAKQFAGLLADNRAWWANFWNRGFVWLHSADGAADIVQRHYLYYLYLMGSTSRGKYPTKFNGMLWTTGGDERQWGNQFWGANQSCLYNALFPTNRIELLDPMFDMYTGMAEACSVAARQQWGSQGIFFPETVGFDGLASLPEPIAAEMRDLYLARKPMTEASPAFLEFARMRMPHSSRWNWWEKGAMQGDQWQPTQRPEAPFGAVTHIFSRGAKIAYVYWQRYEFTRDEAWLRDRAYPILRGVAEFYRNFPNTQKGADGKYHIHHVNSNESLRDATDTDEEIASMRGIFPALIRASEILNVDADMRPVWQEFLDNLAPLPRSDSPEIVAWRAQNANAGRRGGGSTSDARPTWARGLPPVRSGGLGRPDGNTMPMWFFDLCTLENPDAETMAVANATLDGYGSRGAGVLSKVPVVMAMMGRADAVRTLVPAQLATPDRAPAMANRMDQREGKQTTSAQRLGRAADAVNNALLQSVGAGPAADPVIHVFPACPQDWDAAFTLLARGGFLVTSAHRGGKVEFIAIESQLGGPCRVRNPWGEGEITLYRNGAEAQKIGGSLLTFDTTMSERITLTPAGVALESLNRTLTK